MIKRFTLLLGAVTTILVLVVFGTWFYRYSEGWSIVNSLYFTVMTLTTVGYGDFVPSHDVSKIVTVVYGIISIPIMLFILGVLAENYFEVRMKGLESRLRDILSQEKEIEEEIEETEEKIVNAKKSAIIE
ncbi:MAG: potassium channel family protein [Patescibacteria group bacterium]